MIWWILLAIYLLPGLHAAGYFQRKSVEESLRWQYTVSSGEIAALFITSLILWPMAWWYHHKEGAP